MIRVIVTRMDRRAYLEFTLYKHFFTCSAFIYGVYNKIFHQSDYNTVERVMNGKGCDIKQIAYFSDHKTHHDFFIRHFRKKIMMNVF